LEEKAERLSKEREPLIGGGPSDSG
jgi:hypothetical protein